MVSTQDEGNEAVFELFLRTGLDRNTANHALLNPKISASLISLIQEAGVEDGCAKAIGKLLYMVTDLKHIGPIQVATKYPANAMKHQSFIVQYIATQKIKNANQLEKGLLYLSDIGPNNIKVDEFEEACGVGIAGKENLGIPNSPALVTMTVGRRKQLSDVSNTNASPYSLDINQKSIIEHYKKEVHFLKSRLVEQEAILETTKREMQKMLCNYYKTAQQNKQLAQANSQMFGELCMIREKLKLLEHECNQMSAAFKYRKRELEDKIEDLTKKLVDKNEPQIMMPDGNHILTSPQQFISNHHAFDEKKGGTQRKRGCSGNPHPRKKEHNQSFSFIDRETADEVLAGNKSHQLNKVDEASDINESSSDSVDNMETFKDNIQDRSSISGRDALINGRAPGNTLINGKAPRNKRLKPLTNPLEKERSLKIKPSRRGQSCEQLETEEIIGNADANGAEKIDRQREGNNKKNKRLCVRRNRKTLNQKSPAVVRMEIKEEDFKGSNDDDFRRPLGTTDKGALSCRHAEGGRLDLQTQLEADGDSLMEPLNLINICDGDIHANKAKDSQSENGFPNVEANMDKKPSLRRRSTNICYKEPSLNVKLRRSGVSSTKNFFVKDNADETKLEPLETVKEETEKDNGNKIKKPHQLQESATKVIDSTKENGQIFNEHIQMPKTLGRQSLKSNEASEFYNTPEAACYNYSSTSASLNYEIKGSETDQNAIPDNACMDAPQQGSSITAEEDIDKEQHQKFENAKCPVSLSNGNDDPLLPRRASTGRPVRKAAVIINTYKEIPLKVKLRRAD